MPSESPALGRAQRRTGARASTARRAWKRGLVVLGALAAFLDGQEALAQGFQLDRYEPSAAGSWFFGVEHPWYSSTRWVAAGLTLDYGHDALLGGQYDATGKFSERVAIVAHELVTHVDVAGSFLDRVQVQASLPVVLLEQGTPGYQLTPPSGVVVGDPRVGVMARIWGQPDRDPVSVHAAVQLWIPVGESRSLAGDPNVRGMPSIIVAGYAKHHVRWAFSGGVLIRGNTSLGSGPASSIGSELQLRAGLGYGDAARRYNVGPEVTLSTAITGANAASAKATSVEVLIGGQWNIARQVQLGAGVGSGLVPTLGTPDARVLFRIAYAPERSQRPGDLDGDGVPDATDACPDEPGARARSPRNNGCHDEDGDGVPDAEDLCPAVRGGIRAGGCPQKDQDGDGVPDAEDLCPDREAGAHPDAHTVGCPARDTDGDGVPDADDLCPDVGAGTRADPGAVGCPQKDSDEDGVPDREDACPTTAAGKLADPARKGCPLSDADGDGVPDRDDACPNLAGVPGTSRGKNGCPAIDSREGSRTELREVLFPTNESRLLPSSFAVLDEVARLVNEHPELKTIHIEGHADDTGTHEWNLRLSRHRAESVVRYLIEHGVNDRRLRAVGYGDRRPVSTDRSDEARARNRRVEMRIPAR